MRESEQHLKNFRGAEVNLYREEETTKLLLKHIDKQKKEIQRLNLRTAEIVRETENAKYVDVGVNSVDPRDYQRHPSGELNMKWNGNPSGKDKCAPRQGSRGSFGGQEHLNTAKDSRGGSKRPDANSYDDVDPIFSKEEMTAFYFFGITKTSSLGQVKKRYKFLSRAYHPDCSTGNAEKMIECNQHYSVLKSYFKG